MYTFDVKHSLSIDFCSALMHGLSSLLSIFIENILCFLCHGHPLSSIFRPLCFDAVHRAYGILFIPFHYFMLYPILLLRCIRSRSVVFHLSFELTNFLYIFHTHRSLRIIFLLFQSGAFSSSWKPM